MQADSIVIGAGAAGYFASAELLRLQPGIRILMLEKTGKTLSKVRISGGGRCNVTHDCLDPEALLQFYPRGNPWLQAAFARFSVGDTLRWFRERGVPIVREADGRMFPSSNNSLSIVNALEKGVRQPGFQLRHHAVVRSIQPQENGFRVELEGGELLETRFVLVASGGGPNARSLDFLDGLNLNRVQPVPSLFTFNLFQHPWKELAGLSVPDAEVKITGTAFRFRGPVLATHWGLSGPAVLKLSAFAARWMAEREYRYGVEIDFLPSLSAKDLDEKLRIYQESHPKQKPEGHPLFDLPRRLWEQLCRESGLADSYNWAEAGKKKRLALVECLKNKRFQAQGKTTYKEEFVTAGGIDLAEIDPDRCESRQHPGLFFAGEVLDVDGITGGFNFQAAWSTAHTAAVWMARGFKV